MSNRVKILLAEDNVVQRAYLSKLIETLGFDPVPAEDGKEALDLVRASKIQIVISDYQMPKLNGIELTRAIRQLELDHYVYIIMITGSEDDTVRSLALDVGVDDFLNKTRSPVMLNARIRSAIRLINHAEELAERTRVLKESNDQIREDLRAAAAAQRQLLPDIRKELLGFTVASAFVPSSFVSGDMFGCFELAENKLGFYAVDVSGHGVHASLLSVAIGYLITPEFFATIALEENGRPDPAALVANLNTRFCNNDNDDYFTMFCGVINTLNGQLDYCQAGYPSPYNVSPPGDAQPVGKGGFPVGMLDFATYENETTMIEPGGTLILCSDAASEAENDDNTVFGLGRVRALAATVQTVGTRNLPDHVVKTLTDWRNGNSLEDDLTVVALGRRDPNDSHDAT